MIDQVLRTCINGTDLPADCDRRLSVLRESLEMVKGLREDVSEDVWMSGLHAIRDSVKLHSALKPGERSYLGFVNQYF